MSNPFFIVAGQSNARLAAADLAAAGNPPGRLSGDALVFGGGVHANGAPLTFAYDRPDWFSRGELPAQLIGALRAHLSADPQAHLSGILWLQGEGDTHATLRPGSYSARLTALVDQVAAGLADFGARADGFSLVVAALSAQAPIAAHRVAWDTIRAQQLSLDHPRISVVDPDSIAAPPGVGPMFLGDGLHYAPGFRAVLTARMGDLLPRLLRGDGADNTLAGRGGQDRALGGDGDDRLFGRGGDDSLTGDSGNDRLWGGFGDDRLAGGSGRDVIYGGAGNDRLTGGADTDWMAGGSGADVFCFGGGETSARQVGRHDVVADFTRGQDRIDLSAIDAVTETPQNDAFRFLGSAAFTDRAGELRYFQGSGGLMLVGDTDGDGTGDFFLRLNGPGLLVATDLIL